jgi:argininosuccinate lyase
MPGYTHLRQAQLVRFSHYLLALFFMLQRDQERLAGCFKRCDILPLGSGALGGNALGLDRKFLARQLGFKAVSANSIDAVSDRDFIIEFLGACAILAMHLSRFCEDLIIWSTPEFGFVTLAEQFATGSSLMPQKKNPDSLELVRGKSGRIYGNLFALLTVMKGLPLAYAKDLQEDKEPLFDTARTAGEIVQVFTGVIRTLKVNKKAIAQQIGNSLYATDLVEYLVKQGVAFRKAHQQVGSMIRQGTFIQTLEKAGLANPQRSVDRKNADGGTSRTSIARQLTAAKKMLRKGLASI